MAKAPDLSPLGDVVPEKVLYAMRKAHEMLSKLGVRHALVGGLAVGAHGYPRNTKDVDFIVGEEAFNHHEGGIVTTREGVPLKIGRVAVDPISISEDEKHLAAALDTPLIVDGMPVAPVEALVYMKLKSPRLKDAADVVELLRTGIEAKAILRYLETNAPGLLSKFDDLVKKAGEQDDSGEA